jgi:hypothetical protein
MLNIVPEIFGKSKIGHEYFQIFLESGNLLGVSRPLRYYQETNNNPSNPQKSLKGRFLIVAQRTNPALRRGLEGRRAQ